VKLVITVSFLPIFALEAQEGRLFKPLAYTRTFGAAEMAAGRRPRRRRGRGEGEGAAS